MTEPGGLEALVLTALAEAVRDGGTSAGAPGAPSGSVPGTAAPPTGGTDPAALLLGTLPSDLPPGTPMAPPLPSGAIPTGPLEGSPPAVSAPGPTTGTPGVPAAGAVPPWLLDPSTSPADGEGATTAAAEAAGPSKARPPDDVRPTDVERGMKAGGRRDPRAASDPLPSARDSAAGTAAAVSAGQDASQYSPDLVAFRASDAYPRHDAARGAPDRSPEGGPAASAAGAGAQPWTADAVVPVAPPGGTAHTVPPWMAAHPQGPTVPARPEGAEATSSGERPSSGSGWLHRPFRSGSGHSTEGVRQDFPALQQEVGGKPLVWLDNGATTQKPQVVIDTVSRFYERDNSNVHRGAHTLAARATDAYEEAREKVQRFLGAASASEVVFVRGATEAINLVAQAWGRQNVGAGDEVLLTRLEHHANIVPWQMLAEETGALLRVVPVDDHGNVRLDVYESMLSPRVKLVGVTQVANTIGTVVPVGPMAAMAHAHGALLLVDGAQSAAHLPVDVKCLGADFFVFSGHKIYGPTGIGVLWARRELLESMPPWQGGGSMIRDVTFERTAYADPPTKFEAGTPHLAGAIGLGAALDYVEAIGRPQIAAYEHALLEQMLMGLGSVPGLRVIGDPMVRAAAVSFVMDGWEPQEIASHLDREGIAVRAGHHCAQPALRRFGLEASVRASLGVYNEPSDIERLVDALKALGHRRGRRDDGDLDLPDAQVPLI